MSSGSRYTESQTILYQMLVVFDRRNVVCYAYSPSLPYKLDLNNYTANKQQKTTQKSDAKTEDRQSLV